MPGSRRARRQVAAGSAGTAGDSRLPSGVLLLLQLLPLPLPPLDILLYNNPVQVAALCVAVCVCGCVPPPAQRSVVGYAGGRTTPVSPKLPLRTEN